MKLFSFLTEFNSQILGINYRNQELMRKLNPKKARRLADSKLFTKKILRKNKIAIPEIYRIIRNEAEIDSIDWETFPKSFVIKPNRGAQGKGIKVFYGRKKKQLAWIAADGQVYTPAQIIKHLNDILLGRFSLGHKRDIAFIEERIQNHPVLKPYSYKGIPDIRIIIYKGIPLMGMLRLPTKKAGGTANLHAGGISVGIDMASGITTTAIHLRGFDLIGDRYEIIETTLEKPFLQLRGIQIPYWKKILELAVRVQKLTDLGYLAIDVAIDRNKGPVVLELNARPGLGIQMANQAGLLERINRVKGMKVKTVTKAIKLSQALFGGEIEEEVEQLTGRQIIGIIETIKIFPNPNVKKKKRKPKPEKIKAKIDTGALYSSLDYKLALRLGYNFLEQYREVTQKGFKDHEEAVRFWKTMKDLFPPEDRPEQLAYFSLVKSSNGFSVRPTIKVKIELGEETKEVLFTIADRSSLNYATIIGRRDLKGFLIDPTKTFGLPNKFSKTTE